MQSSISLTKTTYDGLLLFSPIASRIKTKTKPKLMNSYYFIDTNSNSNANTTLTPFGSPQRTFANSSFFPKQKIKKKPNQSQFLTKNQLITSTEEKKEANSNNNNTKYPPMLNNMSSTSILLPHQKKKQLREKIDLINFLTETKKKKYVREKEKDQEAIKTKMGETSKKIRLMKSMCDFIYPYILKVKEDRIQCQIDCIKDKEKKRKKKKNTFTLPDYMPVKLLYNQKVFHDKLYYYSDKEQK